MASTSLEKRVSFALIASALVHAAMLALLVWRGGVFSPAGIISGPVDFIEGAVRAQPAPRLPKPVAPKKETRVVPKKDETGIATSKAAEPEAAPTTSSDATPSTAAASTAPKGAVVGRDPSEMSRYVGLLVAAVQKNRRYPKDAIDREEEGVVGLTVKLGSNGDLIQVAVKHPSPFASLNDAAMKTVQTIARFPKPPIADGTTIELFIPMRFKIERL